MGAVSRIHAGNDAPMDASGADGGVEMAVRRAGAGGPVQRRSAVVGMGGGTIGAPVTRDSQERALHHLCSHPVFNLDSAKPGTPWCSVPEPARLACATGATSRVGMLWRAGSGL